MATIVITDATSPEVITSLTNGQSYDFRVAAINAYGTGPYAEDSATPVGGAAPTVPAAPFPFDASPLDGSVSLVWQHPSTGGAAITNNEIQWQIAGAGTWGSNTVVSARTSYTVSPLTNDTAYDFRVRAQNSVGWSNWTQVSNVAPAAGGDPEGNWAIQYDLGGIEMIDWWEWSWDVANNDLFQVKARAQGPNYYCSPYGSGSQSGANAGNAWSAATMKTNVNNRSLPAGSIINMVAGVYPEIGQFTGGGGGGGWVTLLGPPASEGVAEINGTYDRYWSMTAQASRMQFVRLSAIDPNQIDAFNVYSGGSQTDDLAMTQALGYSGNKVGSVGFQMDGWNHVGNNCGPMVTVSCRAFGMGEGFGSARAGNYFALGCLAEECAVASPNGRSGFSFSIENAGYGPDETSSLVQSSNLATTENYYMGTFACVSAHNAQMIDSAGIGLNGQVNDGNGFNLPTDKYDIWGRRQYVPSRTQQFSSAMLHCHQ